MSLDQMTCPEHGWFGHFGIHEAGHATAAILLDFKFVEVSINPGHDVYRQMMLGEEVVGAGVLMPGEPVEWVAPRPEDALVYLLAGSLAEAELCGHYLPGGYEGDLKIWRLGSGRSEAQTDEVRPVLREGIERAQTLLSENRSALLRVYGMMVQRVPNDGRMHTGFDEPLLLSHDEVHSAVIAKP
ncbi:hypothetical protein [Arthrobacter bussei]|uniref:Uncharacterized protein n=1 Tax=Arthrobacter bussei TaxID=2594179 RepID=A0A7X1NQT2_9MICC|nr:hypothetical protein [Arthrobacter bussei]MPY11177.1 hypothetical protein [Arthrobacter bussei]